MLIRDNTLYKIAGGEIAVVAKNDGSFVGMSYWGTGHLSMIRNFYSALQTGNEYYCDISEALPSLRIIEEIYKNCDKTLVRKVF